MRIEVKVRANASKNEVVKTDEGVYRISTTATPERGKANDAVLELLAEELRVPRSALTIKMGKTSPKKIVEVRL